MTFQPKRSVSFSLNDKQFLMLEEIVLQQNTTRSKWIRQKIDEDYREHGSAEIVGAHAAPFKARFWVPDKDRCNPNLFCAICTPKYRSDKNE